MAEASCGVVIPAHNEESIIAESIQTIRETLKDGRRTWEIIVVDDGSTDATCEKAKQAVENAGKVIRHPACLGKASAIVTGVQNCAMTRVLFSDADLSVPPAFFEMAVLLLDEWDVAISSRHLPGSKLLRRQPWLREHCGEIFRRGVRRFFLPTVSDFTCGLKAFRTEAAKKLFDGLTCLDWTFDVEVLLRARRANLRIAEFPVDWSNRPDSRVRLIRAVFGSLVSLIKLHRTYGDHT